MKLNFNPIIKLLVAFLIGFLCASFAYGYFLYDNELPFSPGSNITKEAPSNFINENQIQIFPDKIVININGASLARYAPTGSMKPVLDENSNGIRIAPKSEEDINVGDIVSFRQNDYLVVHRVINKGKDEQGTYFITKGDNASIPDGKIRFKDIEYITIGVLW
jgi:hypothetical protein